MSKSLYIVTVEEKYYTNNYVDGKSIPQIKTTTFEEFIYADSEKDATATWKLERQKKIDEELECAFKHYKTDFVTWCTNYGWNKANEYVDCKFHHTTNKYRRYKRCPWCKGKTIHHRNIEAEKKKSLKFAMDGKKPVKVRLFRARKSRSVGIYKWPKRKY